uniref:RING-type E3 ubiquitin transferase n=1 Tax=Takifugu rubripes TaxID=31033 RepID=A0A674MA54_TAKRU
MAEASLRSGRFFCHRCSKEISPRLPDYTCPVCESGFIEELSEERRYFENTGPPPADKERIKSLPIISITEEHVGM